MRTAGRNAEDRVTTAGQLFPNFPMFIVTECIDAVRVVGGTAGNEPE